MLEVVAGKGAGNVLHRHRYGRDGAEIPLGRHVEAGKEIALEAIQHFDTRLSRQEFCQVRRLERYSLEFKVQWLIGEQSDVSRVNLRVYGTLHGTRQSADAATKPCYADGGMMPVIWQKLSRWANCTSTII